MQCRCARHAYVNKDKRIAIWKSINSRIIFPEEWSTSTSRDGSIEVVESSLLFLDQPLLLAEPDDKEGMCGSSLPKHQTPSKQPERPCGENHSCCDYHESLCLRVRLMNFFSLLHQLPCESFDFDVPDVSGPKPLII